MNAIIGFQCTGKTTVIRNELAINAVKKMRKTLIIDSWNEYVEYEALPHDKLLEFCKDKDYATKRIVCDRTEEIKEIIQLAVREMTGHLIIEMPPFCGLNSFYGELSEIKSKKVEVTVVTLSLNEIHLLLPMVKRLRLHWTSDRYRAKYLKQKICKIQKTIDEAYHNFGRKYCYKEIKLAA